jgi:uncharacterized protein Smg (DUF494 family)
MKHSLIELVDAIIQEIQKNPAEPVSEYGIRKWLARQGYNKRDIEDALRVVKPRFEDGPRVLVQNPGAVRHFSSYEEAKMSAEARNALVRLELYELIEPYERELLLDRLEHFEGDVGLEELDYLLSWVIGENRDVEYQHTLYNVLEDSNDMLH